ncbi:hypothetical protein RSSM_00168 [Rhodopirellula sallentina SM41]|uniref:Uncharacterized protein n=1 Tax=Rhodopirellula sallentina SM41 TaxID=1263870 RepID=M5UAS0_9BACT|nr:hypothetical protein RSSM_00168 [Rhodopirellula sallentina SM41]
MEGKGLDKSGGRQGTGSPHCPLSLRKLADRQSEFCLFGRPSRIATDDFIDTTAKSFQSPPIQDAGCARAVRPAHLPPSENRPPRARLPRRGCHRRTALEQGTQNRAFKTGHSGPARTTGLSIVRVSNRTLCESPAQPSRTRSLLKPP